MMKGMLKRALGVVAAAAMAVTGAVALSGTANAAVGDIVTTPATITINAGDPSQFTGRDLKYIKLAEYDVYEAADQSSVLSIHTVDNVRFYVERALETVTTDSDPKTPSYDAGKDGDPMAWIANNLENSGEAPYSGVLRDFVTELYNTEGFDVKDNMPTPTGSDASRTYTMATPGVYLIVDEGATKVGNAATQAIPMLVGTQIKVKNGSDAKVPGIPTPVENEDYGILAGQVNLKNELTPVEKTVSGEGATPGVGDTRTYTITGKVPNWVGKDLSDTANPQPVFTFTDTPGKGQTVDYSSINVQLVRKDDVDPGMSTNTVDRSQYTVTQYVATDTTGSDPQFTKTEVNANNDQPAELKADGVSYFVVDLTNYMKDAAVNDDLIGLDVVLTYDVTVNADAVNLEGNIANTVKVDNNGSTNEASASLPKPQTITFKKTDRDNNVLAGAQFSLVKEGDTDADDAFVKVAETTTDTPGSYIVDPVTGVQADGTRTEDQDGTVKRNPLVSGTDGMVTVKGLGEGTYTVTETHAPDGFIEVGLPSFTVTIGHDADGNPTVTYGKGSDPFDLVTMPIKNDPLTVMNVRSITQLPLTGAAGITLFMVLGLLIAGAGVTVYMKSRNIRKAMR